MAVFRESAGKSLRAVMPLVALSMLLGACTPLDQDGNSPAPTGAPSAAASPTPSIDSAFWENCTDPAITAGKSTDKEQTLVAAILVVNSMGSRENRILLDKPAQASIAWDSRGPATARFDEEISQAIELRTAGSSGETAELASTYKDAGSTTNATIAYKYVEGVTVPVTLDCGKNLLSTGTVNTWKIAGSGILDCTLAFKPGELDAPSLEAKKRYCPQS